PNKAVTNVAGPVVWTAPRHQYIKSIAVAANGSSFAVVSTNRRVATTTIECNAYYFSLEAGGSSYFSTSKTPASAWPLTNCTGTVSVAVNGNGSRVAAVGNIGNGNGGAISGSVFLFDPASNAPLWQRPTAHGPNAVSLDAAGQQVAVADGFLLSGGAFYLFDALGAKMPINGLGQNQPVVGSWTIHLSANGTAMAAGSDDSKVYYFNV